jgi:hypothetical protein
MGGGEAGEGFAPGPPPGLLLDRPYGMVDHGFMAYAMKQEIDNMSRQRIESIATERVLRVINNVDSQPLIEAFMASTEVGGPVKNVCAKLTKQLVETMEDRCALLNINKRQFIEAAILDAIALVDAVSEAEGLHDVLAERAERAEHNQENVA